MAQVVGGALTPTEFTERMAAGPPAEGDSFWSARCRDLRAEVLSGKDPTKFLTWSCVYATMFIGTGASFTPLQLDYLRSRPDWASRWRWAIEEHAFGAPEVLYAKHNGAATIPTSGNLINQAYSLAKWEEATGRRVDSLRQIIEVGGGYGSMCRLAHKLGFSGTYVLYDLPEYLLLQQLYLNNVDLSPYCDIVFSGDLDWLAPFPYELLVANYSLSEMARKEREEVLEKIHADHYEIRYVDAQWEGENGRPWFKAWADGVIGGGHKDVHLWDEHWMVAA